MQHAEQKGLRLLRSANRSNGCAGHGSRIRMAWNAFLTVFARPPALSSLGALDGSRATLTGDDRGAVLGARASSSDIPADGSAGLDDRSAVRTASSTAGDDGGPPLLLIFLAALAVLAVLAATPLLLRRRGEARAGAASPEAVVDEPSLAPVAPVPPWSRPARAATASEAAPAQEAEQPVEAEHDDEPVQAAPAEQADEPQPPVAAEPVPAREPIPARETEPARSTENGLRTLGIALSGAISLAAGLVMRGRRRRGR